MTEARAKATSITVSADDLKDPAKVKAFQDAQNQLSGALGRLLAVQEAYPQLQADQNFLALQSQLEGTENRIAVARTDYNAAVQGYNTLIRTFPAAVTRQDHLRREADHAVPGDRPQRRGRAQGQLLRRSCDLRHRLAESIRHPSGSWDLGPSCAARHTSSQLPLG